MSARNRSKNSSFGAWMHDHFIPHHGNDHKPKALRHKALLSYSVFLVLVKVALIGAQVLLPSASLYSSSVTRANIVDLTNSSRQAAGLETLTTNSLLNGAAQAKAEDMITNQYFAHNSPDGLTPWSFIGGAGYSYVVAGENLAIHYTQAEDVTAGWMASPTHKANIMDERFNEIGVGIVRGTFDGYEDTVVVVQMFGQSALVEPEVVEPEVTEEAQPEVINVALAEEGVEVTVNAPEAEEVAVSLNEDREKLTSDGEGNWTGTIETDSIAEDIDGADLYVHVDQEGETVTETAAWIAGSSDSREVFYVDSGDKSTYLFGAIKIGGLDDVVRQFYFLTMVLLAAALLMKVLVKFELQHHTTTAHVLVVMLLAGALAII